MHEKVCQRWFSTNNKSQNVQHMMKVFCKSKPKHDQPHFAEPSEDEKVFLQSAGFKFCCIESLKQTVITLVYIRMRLDQVRMLNCMTVHLHV